MLLKMSEAGFKNLWIGVESANDHILNLSKKGTQIESINKSIPPKMSVGSVVRLIKSNTARDLKQQFPFLKKCYYGTQSVWSDGYFVTTAGANEAVIKLYIQMQGQEDIGQAKLELE